MTILAWEPGVMPHEIDNVRPPELPGDEIATAYRLQDQARACCDAGRYDEAERLYRHALDVIDSAPGAR